MERHKCNLCLKSFANGRALGGHMRSHTLNLPIPPKSEEDSPIQLSEQTDSAFSSSEEEAEAEAEAKGEEEEEEEEEEEKGAYYGLRENPKKSVRLVDHEFSFAVDAGSVVLQDRESETESSKNPTRRRSKRNRKLLDYHHHHQYNLHYQEQEQNNMVKKVKFNNLSKTESWVVEPEPVSSISDTTTEEDVAFCLMMLSRDKWKRKEQHIQQQEQAEEAENEKSNEETDESDELKSSKTRSRGRYKCETCKKVFKSYQALGGHRASHKKLKAYAATQERDFQAENVAGTSTSVVEEKKTHECPYCFRVFSSGQALGGHKRSHVIGVAATTPVRSSTKLGDNLNLIDLNLPAPMDDDDDISQIDLSAVSEAEFVNHIKR